MALVDYPSSSEDEDKAPEEVQAPSSSRTSTTKNSLKRKHSESESANSPPLPPLPSKFHDLYASTTRPSTRDDPSLHGGRKRVTPHVEGNWPSHVYIEWYPSTAEHASLSTLIANLKDTLVKEEQHGGSAPFEIQSFLISDLGAPLPLHISLSRPIGFLTERKASFSSSLERSIRTSGIRPFKVKFLSLQWVSNFEATRWFLVLKVQKPQGDALNRLLHLTNTVVQENGQPPLYTLPTAPTLTPTTSANTANKKSQPRHRQSNPALDWSKIPDMTEAFHFSIAWSLTVPSEEVQATTRSAMERFGKDEVLAKMEVDVGEVKVKIGNVVTAVELARGVVESGGLFGL